MTSASWLLSHPESFLFLSALLFTANGPFIFGKKFCAGLARALEIQSSVPPQSGWFGQQRKQWGEGSAGNLMVGEVWGRGGGVKAVSSAWAFVLQLEGPVALTEEKPQWLEEGNEREGGKGPLRKVSPAFLLGFWQKSSSQTSGIPHCRIPAAEGEHTQSPKWYVHTLPTLPSRFSSAFFFFFPFKCIHLTLMGAWQWGGQRW